MKILDNEGDPDWCKGMNCSNELKKELITQYKGRLMKEIKFYLKDKKKISAIQKYDWKKMRSFLETLK
tara:strand:- start:335 stop:538 length:204 start_codon:yes stop_codon:yes gene_type:complete